MYIRLWRFRLYLSIRASATKHATSYGITRNGHGARARARAANIDAQWQDLRNWMEARRTTGEVN